MIKRRFMFYKKCYKKHGHKWQGMCMAERWKCKYFSISYIEDYCPICNKIRTKWMITDFALLKHKGKYKL